MIYYLGYYNCDKTRGESRLVSPASENKTSYIVSSLARVTDEKIQVVSPAVTTANRFVKGKNHKIGDRVCLKTFSSFSSRNKLIRGFGHIFTKICVFLYLLFHLKKSDHLFVYHSLFSMNLVRWMKKWKKCRLTIEVEELYSDVTENEDVRKQELAYFQIADHYIFITELLKNEINTIKPSVISHGNYQSVKKLPFGFSDDKIHVVYAGTLDPIKGGAFTAIEAARFLDEKYVLEILGAGSKEDIMAVEEAIKKVSETTNCQVRYVGCKYGEDFNSYLQACHIGLSTQQAEAKFNATSFPSKVLTYMANGLQVVSVRIPAVETSLVGDFLYYYDRQDAKVIAEVIQSVSLNDGYDSRELLNQLDEKFLKDLKTLL